MHQHPRLTPRATHSADVPAQSPSRATDAAGRPPTRTRSSVDLSSYTERLTADDGSTRTRTEEAGGNQEKDHKRLNQIVQNFHSKAALTICSSRISLPPALDKNGEVRQNRWFNLILDETDLLAEALLEWKRADLITHSPSPMVIEIYLDSSQLTHNQVLVISDEAGRRWDVAEALSASGISAQSTSRNGNEHHEIVLERWTISLGDGSGYSSAELNDLLPNIYKKGVVLFRSLYALLRILPAWKLHRRLSRLSGGQQNLKLNYRIRSAQPSQQPGRPDGAFDTLYIPLCPSQRSLLSTVGEHVQSQIFEPLRCPAGVLQIAVDYRESALFSAEEAESLLSSRFLGMDRGLPIPQQVGRSLPGSRTRHTEGSVPTPFGSVNNGERTSSRHSRGLLGAYGSLGTFHAPEKRPSPVTELRQRIIYHEDDDDNAEEGAPQSIGSRHRPRSSVDLIRNPPFKAGSLTSTPPRSSPLARNVPSPTASSSSNYESSQMSDQSKSAGRSQRAALTSARPGPTPTMLGQTKKYSSSFSDRKGRYIPGSAGSGFRKIDGISDNSGGEDSRPVSADLSNIGGIPGSLGSGRPSSTASFSARSGSETVMDDMDCISQFLHDLDVAATQSRRTEASPGTDVRAGPKAFSVDLGQFSKYRSGNTTLAQEMQKSTTEPTPPSRRLSNVPGLSTSSSPRGLAHTPVVRSRLSTQSVVEETAEPSQEGPESLGARHDEDDEDEPFIFGHVMD